MKRAGLKSKIIILGFLAVLVLQMLSGCKIGYMPGASYGYYIWEDGGSIFVEWSTDQRDSKFSGKILTDGKIISHKLDQWEESDEIKVEKGEIKFSAALSKQDYSDGFSFNVKDYTYIEFDLKINDGYDLSRTNVGGFLDNPESGVFRIGKDYFDQLKMKHWYQERPFSEFFKKLFYNKYFTFIYLFILGVIIIEILRITVLVNSRKAIWLSVLYAALVLVEICIYFILRFLIR